MKRSFMGLVLITLGVLALLQGTGQFNFGLSFWPAVLVFVGSGMAFSALRIWPNWFQLGLGLWVGCIGLFTILHDAGVVEVSGRYIATQGWPILLIAIGIGVIFGRRFHFGGKWKSHKGEYRMVGDLRFGSDTWHLDKDLNLDHGVGDLKLDLTSAEITEGTHRITVKGAIGDILIRVPDNVNATIDASAGIGEINVMGNQRGGLGLSLNHSVYAPDSKVELLIETKLGIGQIRVVQLPAQTGRLIL